MVSVSLDSNEVFDLLVAAPGTKEEKQTFFIEQFDARVPRTSYEIMLDRLADELGDEQAAEAVCAFVLSSTDSRAIKLLKRAIKGRPVSLRFDEPSLVELLFESDDELTPIGEALADRLRQPVSRVAESPHPPGQLLEGSAPRVRHTPQLANSTEGADVILDWHRADPETPDRGPWRWSVCMYAYLHPGTQDVLYVGKTDQMTVRARFVSNFKRKFHDLYARLGILKVDVIAARVELAVSSRLTSQWLDDLESLLIISLQPPLNDRNRKSRRNARPGTVVVCTGDWPLESARFVDGG